MPVNKDILKQRLTINAVFVLTGVVRFFDTETTCASDETDALGATSAFGGVATAVRKTDMGAS
jgi:hypothetical protein